MASDRSQYNHALRRWDALHRDQAYSLPIDDGDVAILCSDFQLLDNDDKDFERVAFENEADDIARLLSERGIGSRVFVGFTLEDAEQALTDSRFSSIVSIGNGNLSESYAHGGESFDWRFVSAHSTHLKTGRFTLRHCGQPIRDLSVPLGTFGLGNHSDVFAAYNQSLPTIMEDSDEKRIARLHTHHRLGYRMLKNLFIRIELAKDDEDS